MHPQTLRVYESKGLVNPQRSGGNTRLNSRADIERLELINQLTDEGINLAGVVRILDMKERAEERERESEKLRARVRQLKTSSMSSRCRSASPPWPRATAARTPSRFCADCWEAAACRAARDLEDTDGLLCPLHLCARQVQGARSYGVGSVRRDVFGPHPSRAPKGTSLSGGAGSLSANHDNPTRNPSIGGGAVIAS